MNRRFDVDVLIAGGGPTGLVLAVELGRRGIGARIIDKAAEFFGGSRADGLTPRTQEVFEDIGILAKIRASGDDGILMRGYDGDRVIWEGRMTEPTAPTPDLPYAGVWFVPQYRTEEILRDRLGGLGGQVELNTALVGFEQDEDGVTVELLRDGDIERARARYLVGADGGHSVVRGLLGVGFPGETDESTRALFADVRIDGLDRDHGQVWMLPAGAGAGVGVGAVPLSGSDLFTVTAPPPDTQPPDTQPQDAEPQDAEPQDAEAADGTGDAVESTLDYLRRILATASGRTDFHLRELTWSTVWRANKRLADAYRVGRVFLAGDAAHLTHPTGGQGMNTGIQDAYGLGWKLAAVLGGAPATLLDTYQAERRPAAEAALAVSAKLLAKHQRGDEDALRRGVEVYQLGLNYRGGPLSAELRAAPGRVRAGDRAPDAPCRNASGRPVRLFELFAGPQWTLLCFGTDADGLVAKVGSTEVRAYRVVRPDVAVDEHAVVDVDGYAYWAYGIADETVVLVRPDGYVGLGASPGSVAEVEDYLRSVLGRVRDRSGRCAADHVASSPLTG
ncbi:MAG TPA: FAD-dependent monooxygenase [Pseudonocardiaceae bacterium]|jgi:2-polyprenyl-6-methoxyphenol hydroxylase-like FAD-dependent oxidoreductase|nr:FAD-dependent monooxygenase [Pseudonocardiaceae bacterium]